MQSNLQFFLWEKSCASLPSFKKEDNSARGIEMFIKRAYIRASTIARIPYRCLRTLFTLRSARPSDRDGTVKMISSCFASRIKVHGYGVVKEKMASVVDFTRKQV
jgi:hypothetical protein